MTGPFPQAPVEDLRALDLLVARLAVDLAHVLLDDLPDLPALRVPEHQARCLFLHVEQVELLAELAVVALFGLLDAQDIGGQLLLVGPGRAVDALQLLVLGVATPVGAGDAGQLEGLEETRVRHVRAATHVDVFLVVVEAHGLLVGHVLDQAQLVVLAAGLEFGNDLVARLDPLDHVIFGIDQLDHALFDRGQILGRERPLVPDVVVETFLDDRPDDHLGVGKQLLDRMADQVRAGMADDLDTLLVLRRDDLQLGVMVDAIARVDQSAVDLAGNRGLGQAGADRGRDVGDTDRAFELADAAIGESDVDHGIRDSGKTKRAPKRPLSCSVLRVGSVSGQRFASW